MRPQQFDIIQSDKPSSKRHHFCVWVTFPLERKIAGTIDWNYDHYGYVYSTEISCFMGLNTLQAITQLIDDLNNNRPNKYIDTTTF